MLSRVEEIIAAQLTHQPVERIDGGYRYRLEAGTTDLTFRRPVGEPGPFELCAIATVELVSSAVCRTLLASALRGQTAEVPSGACSVVLRMASGQN